MGPTPERMGGGGGMPPEGNLPPEYYRDPNRIRYGGDRTPDRLLAREREPVAVAEIVHRYLGKKESTWHHANPGSFPYSATVVAETLDSMSEGARYGETPITAEMQEQGITAESLEQTYAELYKEVTTRHEIHDLIAAYWSWIADLSTEAQQIFQTKVSWSTEEAYHYLFTLDHKKEGERFGFGKKIDRAMRVLHANALGVRPDSTPSPEERQELADYMRRPILPPTENMNGEEDLRSKMLVAGALPNVSAIKYTKKEIEAVEKLMTEAAEGDESAVGWAYRLYRFMGEATQNGIKLNYDENGNVILGRDGIAALEGAYANDDLIKIMGKGFRFKRWKDEITPRGADISVLYDGQKLANWPGKVGIGGDERNDSLVVSKMRFVQFEDYPKNVDSKTLSSDQKLLFKRTMYELWWDHGRDLGSMPYENSILFQDREYFLRIFFAAKENSSLYAFLTLGKPDIKALTDVDTWRKFYKALFVCTMGDAGAALVLAARYNSSYEEFYKKSSVENVQGFFKDFFSKPRPDKLFKVDERFERLSKKYLDNEMMTPKDKLEAEIIEMQYAFEWMYLEGSKFLDEQNPAIEWSDSEKNDIDQARKRARRQPYTLLDEAAETIPRGAKKALKDAMANYRAANPPRKTIWDK